MHATINYAARNGKRMRYFANDSSRDTVEIAGRAMRLEDAGDDSPRLDREGFVRVEHHSEVADFADRAAVEAIHREEIASLLRDLTGADHVAVPSGGVLRFAERSGLSGALDNPDCPADAPPRASIEMRGIAYWFED